jgi:maleylpyruvate isomerase
MLLALVGEAAATRGERAELPAVVLVATGEPTGRWMVGDPVAGAPEITGTAAELAEWLTGRSRGRHLRRSDGVRPTQLGRWR